MGRGKSRETEQSDVLPAFTLEEINAILTEMRGIIQEYHEQRLKIDRIHRKVYRKNGFTPENQFQDDDVSWIEGVK